MRALALGLAAGLLLGGCAEGGRLNSSIYDKVVGKEREPESDPKADDLPLPPFPQAKNLLPFEANRSVSIKFFVDAPSIAPQPPDIVRFTLVGKGDGSAENVSYEGFNCTTGDRITYAWGKSDGTWSRARDATWRPIARTDVVRVALYADYLCPGRRPVRTSADGVNALRMGGHPEARSNTGGYAPDPNWR
jgi:hypothetical protein